MKNWKYINGAEGVKVVNEKTQNTWTIQDARRNYDAAKKEFDEKGDLFSKRKLDEVKSIIDKEYYAAYKRLEELERKRNDNLHNKGGSGEIPYYNEAKQNYAHWGLLRETIGNDTPAEYAKRPPKIVGGNSLPEELEKDVEKKDKEKVEEIEKLEKIGNETYQHKLYPDKYVIIQGKNYKIVTDGKVEKSGELTDAVLYGINQTYKKVGNASSEYEILKQDPSKMHPLYKKAYEEAMKKLAREDEDFKKRFEKEYGVKAKNEASDDKFAYVMREFEEGKLKTPDGKVVTDPAQAKAIAYSESKKTENGLARARNAIKK